MKVAIDMGGSTAASGAKRANSDDKVTLYTYVPGSYLGGHNLVLAKNSEVTSVVESCVDEPDKSCKVTVSGHQVSFCWDAGRKPQQVNGSVYTMDGKIVTQFNGPQFVDGVSLEALSAGFILFASTIKLTDSL